MSYTRSWMLKLIVKRELPSLHEPNSNLDNQKQFCKHFVDTVRKFLKICNYCLIDHANVAIHSFRNVPII